ncbi:hypothetical protein [Terribacillus saccharophilus]|nr:hypothetical protein [Terribacillus goriensis]
MYHILHVTEIALLEVIVASIGTGILLLGVIFAFFGIGKYFFHEECRPK